MTTQELSDLNQALAAVGETMCIEERDGSPVYKLCRAVPVREIAEADIAEFAAIFGVEVA